MKKNGVLIFAVGLGIGFLIAAFQTNAFSLLHVLHTEKENQLASVMVVDEPAVYPVSDITTGAVADNDAVFETILAPVVPAPLPQKELEDIDTPAKKVIVPKPSCATANTLSLDAFLFPMSKSFSIDGTYVPEELVQVPIEYVKNKGFICVTKETLASIEAMFADALEDGYTLFVTSGFRSSKTQESLFKYYTDALGLTEAERRSAYPGHSEHQLGTAIDITGGTTAATSQTFGATPEGIWAKEHAPDYGFVLSYDEGKEDITGYMYEPWHFRYVGEDIADDILDEEVTPGEYLLELYEE